MMLVYKKGSKKIVGWSVYFAECADGSLLCGLTKDVENDIKDINEGRKKKRWLSKSTCKKPIKPVFVETTLPFIEAYSKYKYMRLMNRYLRNKLVATKEWPNGGPWKEYFNRVKEIDN